MIFFFTITSLINKSCQGQRISTQLLNILVLLFWINLYYHVPLSQHGTNRTPNMKKVLQQQYLSNMYVRFKHMNNLRDIIIYDTTSNMNYRLHILITKERELMRFPKGQRSQIFVLFWREETSPFHSLNIINLKLRKC